MKSTRSQDDSDLQAETINLHEVKYTAKDGDAEHGEPDGNSPMLTGEATGDASNTDDYDPHLHRNVPSATSNTETLIHLLKGSLGTGILAMPQAFYFAGYGTGIVCTIIIGILCTYCLHVLVQAQYAICKRRRIPMLSYPISMQIALEEGPPALRFLAPAAISIVDGFLIVYQLGICCVYIVFVATNIKQIVDYYLVELDVKVHMVILLLPLILLICIRNLKLLAPFSSFANVITFVGLGLIMYYVFDGISAPAERDAFGSARNFPLFFGTTLFALEAVGVVIAVENNMKTPKSFGGTFGVLNVAMTIITLLYAAIGFLGYLRYGSDCLGSISLNLPQEDIIAQSVKIIFALATFISYGLQGYVPVAIIWGTYLSKRFENSNRKLQWELLVRILIVIATFLLAVAIPRLGLFISLFGALCLSVLGLAFPALMEICVLWPDKLGKFNYILWKDIFLIIFGVAGLVIGTFTSVRDIVISFM